MICGRDPGWSSSTLVLPMILSCNSLGILYWMIGPSSIAAAIYTLCMVPLNSKLAKMGVKNQEELMRFSDKRTTHIHEILNGIRLIKV